MNIKNSLERKLILLSRPKDYLYSYLTCSDKVVRQKKYDPKAKTAAIRLSKKIERHCPGLKTYLFGSLGMAIDGQNDIDLFVTGKPAEVEKYKKQIAEIAGCAGKVKTGIGEWKFRYGSFAAEITLTCEQNDYFIEQKYLFETIQNNPGLLSAYQALKRQLNGKSQREYVIERMIFFNQIITGRKKPVDLNSLNLVILK